MLKDRYKLWLIVIVFCIIAQFTVHTLGPKIVEGVNTMIAEYEQKREEQDKQETVPPVDIVDPNVKTEEDSEKLDATFSTVLSTLSSAALYIGIAIIMFGILNFVLSFARDDVDSTPSAIRTMIIGAMLVGMSILMPKVAEKLENSQESVVTETHNADETDIVMD